MAFRVVCISRTMAAGGEMIGRAVSERLGYRYVDEDLAPRRLKRRTSTRQWSRQSSTGNH
jgi:shikimate kinase